MCKVLYDKELSVVARLTMIYLLSEGKETVEISLDEIGEIINCSKRTMSKALSELEEKGYIEKIRRGLGKSNLYNIIKGE